MAASAREGGRAAVGPLDGVKVVEFGQYIAGPATGQLLCDLGASVLKVEPPGGEPARGGTGLGPSMVANYNRGKQIVELDLTSVEGRARALEAVRESDVVISNLRPGVLKKYGLGAEDSCARTPRLVFVEISGFGTRGAGARRVGLDIAAQAESGIMSINGEEGGPPLRVGFSVVDTVSSYVASQAITSALFRRERTGRGGIVQVSLLDVAIHMQGPMWVSMQLAGREPSRVGNGQPNHAPAADLIQVKDGYVVLSAYVESHWQRLVNALGSPQALRDPRFRTAVERARNRSVLIEALEGLLGDRTRQDVSELFASARVVVGRVRTYSEVLPQGQDPAPPFCAVEDTWPDGSKRTLWTLGLPYAWQETG